MTSEPDTQEPLHGEVARLKREQAIFLKGPVVVFTWGIGPGFPVLDVTPNVAQFGYRSDDFMSGRIGMKKIIFPEDIPAILAQVRTAREKRVIFTETDYRIVCANGDV